MKSVNSNLLKLLSLILIGSWVFVSCNDDDPLDDDGPNDERLFSPTNFSAASGETSVTLSWNASQFAPEGTQYTVEVAKTEAFGDVEYTVTTAELTATVDDTQIDIKTDYFARVKAVGETEDLDSEWTTTDNPFQITGEQLFLPVREQDLTDNSVLLRWQEEATGLTSIVLSIDDEEVRTIALTSADNDAKEKLIEELDANTTYDAELFAGDVSKGNTSFTTKEPSAYDIIIDENTENIRQTIEEAPDGSVIGIEPGEYHITDEAGDEYVSINIVTRKLIIESVSGNPENTTVYFREFNLRGTGAGVTFRGITFDGSVSTANGNNAEYFMNLRGENSDGDAAEFDSFVVENCVVKNMNNCFFRGNRAGNNAHKIDLIKVDNSIISNSALVAPNYGLFIFNKLEFKNFELTNSTFHQIGRSFVDMSVTITMAQTPNVTIDHCTVNGFGTENGEKWLIFDANATDVNLSVTNNIFANAPYPGSATRRTTILRANGENSSLEFSYNNRFNVTTGDSETVYPAEELANNTPLEIPGSVGVVEGDQNVELPWTFDATSFSLPADSPLRTASSTGGPIGDPRWNN